MNLGVDLVLTVWRLMFYPCSNFLTEAPGQYTGPGPGMGLVRQGGGPAHVMVGGQPGQGLQGQQRSSKLSSSLSLSHLN